MKQTLSLIIGLAVLASTTVTNAREDSEVIILETNRNVKTQYVKLDRNSIVTSKEKLNEKAKREAEKQKENKPYSEEDLNILSHVICGEAGSSWISDEEQLLVGSVVINRTKSKMYPDTIKGVVFQPGQYSCTKDGNYYRQPDKRTIENAKKLLNGDVICPNNVLYQSSLKQGNVYKKIGNTFFCYK